MEENLKHYLPDDMTFQKAFERTGRAMNVSIAPAETHQTSRLLNATTSPTVLMRSAVMASAAVPGIFPPVTLQALDDDGQLKSYLPSRRWVDGSVSDDMPAKRLARLYGVNHYIVSQTNPHVLPFVTDGMRVCAPPANGSMRSP
jgi:NTE family protein